MNYHLLKLYSIEELTTSSIMGVSTKKGQRKGLNEEKKAIIEGNLKFHINITGKLNLTNISSIFFLI